MRLYIGLVHYPVYNKNRQTIASAVTTFDLHDISRLARTYGVKKFFVVTPLDNQRALVERVRKHWTEGYGAAYNVHRKQALELVSVVPSLDQAIVAINGQEGETPLVVATDAVKQLRHSISYDSLSRVIQKGALVFLLFGTAWGLDASVLAEADHVLDPIQGRSGYQHLSVRAAAAIILDRLTGDRIPSGRPVQ
ncbi:MAG: RNA methyltransferase [Deltaproteobacteria bacterium]|nr:MAG: RNA methyltransferase [Deltaproteobacteria bacterium]